MKTITDKEMREYKFLQALESTNKQFGRALKRLADGAPQRCPSCGSERFERSGDREICADCGR